MQILIKNHQRRRSLTRRKITATARKILCLMDQPAAELSIMFVGDKKMSELNAAYRGIDRSTDVLAFPQISGKSEVRNKKFKKAKNPASQFYTSHFPLLTSHFMLGDIVINVPRAESQAIMYGWGFYEEISRLLIHGTLHLLGYDHEKTVYMAGKMRKKEQEILNAVKKMDTKH
jgi:probable rRNA maturation factor